MQNASFAGRFKVGTRIQVGFLLILVLLVLVAALGVGVEWLQEWLWSRPVPSGAGGDGSRTPSSQV